MASCVKNGMHVMRTGSLSEKCPVKQRKQGNFANLSITHDKRFANGLTATAEKNKKSAVNLILPLI